MKKITILFFSLFICLNSLAQQPDKYLSEGNQLIENENYKDAIKLFTQAIEKDNKKEIYYYKRGVAYNKTNKFQLAYTDFTTAIKINNNYAEAYVERAQVFMISKMLQEAINDLDMAIKYATTDSIKIQALISRSSLYYMTRNFTGSYNDSKAVYDADTNSRDALINMAMAKMSMEEKPVALNLLFQVIRDHPNDTMALQNIGYVYSTMEKYDSSLIYLEKAVKLDPKMPFVLSNLAYTQMKLGNSNEAMKNINESIKILPSNSYAFRNRGLIYIDKGDHVKACVDFNDAIQKGFTDMYGNEVSDLIDTYCKEKK